MSMHRRRKAREHALQVLCLLDSQPELAPAEALALYQRHLSRGEDEAADDAPPEPAATGDAAAASRAAAEAGDAEQARYAEALVRGVRGVQPELDRLISGCSRNWRLERMTWVDRNLLRLAAYELRAGGDVPAKVAINEAIELAKRYGTADSSSFINGVLDRLHLDMARP